MKPKQTIFIIGILLLTINTIGQERQSLSINEIREVIQLAIDLPELQQYFHVDSDSTRTPLTIMEFGIINSENLKGIRKFNEEIRVLNKKSIEDENIKAYLNIGDWTYGENNLRVQLEYGIEGILINYRFSRINGKWEIINSIIMEE